MALQRCIGPSGRPLNGGLCAVPRPTRQRRRDHFGQPAPDCDQPPRARPAAPCPVAVRDLSISSAPHRKAWTSRRH